MFGKVKKWLGIEGVKVELEIPTEVSAKKGSIDGVLHMYSMSEQKVSRLRVKVIERYKRGRGKEKLTDEYTIGTIELEQDFEIMPDQPLMVEFNVPFKVTKSDMEELGDRNILLKGIIGLAKTAYSVRSEFRVEAEVEVDGVALDPFDKRPILIK
ncbi:MAG: sporulation protein [Saprospiraceae bacterium]